MLFVFFFVHSVVITDSRPGRVLTPILLFAVESTVPADHSHDRRRRQHVHIVLQTRGPAWYETILTALRIHTSAWLWMKLRLEVVSFACQLAMVRRLFVSSLEEEEPVFASYGLVGTSRPVPRPPFEGGSFRPSDPVLNTGVDRTMLLLSGRGHQE